MIPKKIRFIYGSGPEAMPQHWRDNYHQFKNLHSDWDDSVYGLADHSDLYDYNVVMWSQVMRFQVVYELGGFYSDLDIEFYGPLPDASECSLVLAVERHGGVTDAFFGAAQGNAFIGECYRRAKQWCYAQMEAKRVSIPVLEFFDNAGVHLFSRLAAQHTGFDFVYQKQIHMTEEDFGGKFHPEKGVGILPFEALCRHNAKNWFGWHQCNGTWRPRYADGTANMEMNACIQGGV